MMSSTARDIVAAVRAISNAVDIALDAAFPRFVTVVSRLLTAPEMVSRTVGQLLMPVPRSVSPSPTPSKNMATGCAPVTEAMAPVDMRRFPTRLAMSAVSVSQPAPLFMSWASTAVWVAAANKPACTAAAATAGLTMFCAPSTAAVICDAVLSFDSSVESMCASVSLIPIREPGVDIAYLAQFS